jgi:hypothetical protein
MSSTIHQPFSTHPTDLGFAAASSVTPYSPLEQHHVSCPHVWEAHKAFELESYFALGRHVSTTRAIVDATRESRREAEARANWRIGASTSDK